jgi:hypothetical protein
MNDYDDMGPDFVEMFDMGLSRFPLSIKLWIL